MLRVSEPNLVQVSTICQRVKHAIARLKSFHNTKESSHFSDDSIKSFAGLKKMYKINVTPTTAIGKPITTPQTTCSCELAILVWVTQFDLALALLLGRGCKGYNNLTLTFALFKLIDELAVTHEGS